jgi:hypothetical protein
MKIERIKKIIISFFFLEILFQIWLAYSQAVGADGMARPYLNMKIKK